MSEIRRPRSVVQSGRRAAMPAAAACAPALLPLLAAAAALAMMFTPPLGAGTGRWAQLGLYGGNVRALAADARHPGVLYAGTQYSGIFKSTDGGANWSPASHGLSNGNFVASLAVDPFHPSTVYAVVGLGPVFKSLDAGTSWSPSGEGLDRTDVWAVAVHPVVPGLLYAGTLDGVARSADGGASWKIETAGMPFLPDVRALAIDPIEPNVIYAGTDRSGVFRSADRGASWRLVGLRPRSISALAIDPRSPAVVYAGTDRGIFRITDGVEGWTHLTSCPTAALAVAGRSRSILYAAGCGGVSRSTDRGASWTPAGSGLNGTNAVALAVDPFDPGTIYAGAAGRSALGGVFKSTDRGVSWAASSRGLADLVVNDLAAAATIPTRLYAVVGAAVVGDSDKLFQSTDGGLAWRLIDLAPTATPRALSAVAIAPSDPADVFVADDSFDSPSLWKTTDGGATWTNLPAPRMALLAVDPHSPDTLYGEGNSGSFWRSTDGGQTWAAMGSIDGDPQFYWLGVDPTSTPSILYAAGFIAVDRTTTAAKVVKSVDGGANWTAIDQRLPAGSAGSLGIDPAVPSTLFAATDAGIYKTADDGASWEYLAQGPAGPVLSLVVPSRNTIYAAAADQGVLASHDGGASWTFLNQGLGRRRGILLVADPNSPDTIYLSVPGSGLLTLTHQP
jgi:photosystem II stability/assembly factor-like uncharacterized protein